MNLDPDISRYLGARSIEDWSAAFDRDGFIIFENVLGCDDLSEITAALAPFLSAPKPGRNEFEGRATNRIYALLATGLVFAELAAHEPRRVCRMRSGRGLFALRVSRHQSRSRRNPAAMAF